MIRLFVLVEGHTEESFVKGILAPHLQRWEVFAVPIVVMTSKSASGKKTKGGGSWKNWRKDLTRLVGEQKGPGVRFTSMFDLYGLPKDFPEFSKHRSVADTSVRVELLERAMAAVVGDERLIPYIQRHEFEALVLAGLDALRALLEDADEINAIRALERVVQATGPEDINDGPTTAPSKRLAGASPSYEKTVHGPLATEAKGLPALRATCPHFDAWVTKLESLGERST